MAFEWRGPAAHRALTTLLTPRLVAAAQALAEAVRREAPVRTGRLRDSVEVTESPGKATVTINAPYAGPVDARNPFFERAIDGSIPTIQSKLKG